MRHVPPVGAPDRSVQIRAWLAVALWIGVIALLSGDDFSAAHTRDWLRRFVRFFFPDTPGRVLYALHKTLRKGAHVAAYGVLALLALRALRVSFAAEFRRHALAALLLVASVAIADELMVSTFQPGKAETMLKLADLYGIDVKAVRENAKITAKSGSTVTRRPKPSKASAAA